MRGWGGWEGVDRWHRVALRGMRREEGESSTLYVAVIFYGLSRIMLERESALPTVQDVSEIFDVLAKDIIRSRIPRNIF